MPGRTHEWHAGRPARRVARAALALSTAVACLAASAPLASAYVYWTDNGPGISSTGTTIGRADLDGSGITSTLVGNAAGPGGIVSDGSHIYWANNKSGAYSVGRAALDGSGANPSFVPAAATSGSVFDVTTDGTYIYWTDGSRYVGRARADGTGAVPHFIDMGSTHAPFGITVAGGTLYVGVSGQIMRAPAGGNSAPTVFTTITGFAATSLAVANGYVYWTENNFNNPSPSGVIGRELLNGTGFDESYVTGLAFPTGVATDGNELYWVDHAAGAIGRATIGSSGATNMQPSFISDAGGPWGIALDSAIDATSMSVTCNPPSIAVGSVSACTALVSDSASTSIPTGNVVFSGSGSSFFSGGNSCTLTPRPGGGASCTVAAASSASGAQMLTASYSGDAVHSPSAGAGGFCAGTAAQCGAPGTGGGGGTPPPGGGATAPPICKVPKLKGTSLSTARKRLAAAHCRLGKILRPRARKGHSVGPLVVGFQRLRPGTVMPSGAKVDVRLTARRRHR